MVVISGRRYLWTVIVVGCAALLTSGFRTISSPLDPTWLLLALPAVVSGATVLRLPFVTASFSVGDAFSFAALFLYGVDAATVTVALDTLAISLRLKGPPARTTFNVAATCLAMWSAGALVFWVFRLPLPAQANTVWVGATTIVLCVGIMFALSTALIAGAIATHEGASVRAIWTQHFAHSWANPTACGYAGALIAFATHFFGAKALIAVIPLPLILYVAFRTALGRMNDHGRHLSEVNQMHQATIEAFATAVDAKDQVTHGHIRRVQTYSLAVARDLGANDDATQKGLEAAALLHDVGKIGIPEHILNKPGRLTPDEFEVMKGHVTIGADILSTIDFPFPVVPIVRSHHENWDGTGYPAGVLGEDIPLGARILSVVDCFDALTSDRPYRAAMPVEAAFDILRARSGTMYDPTIVERFITLYPSLSVPRDPEPPAVTTRGLSLAGEAIGDPVGHVHRRHSVDIGHFDSRTAERSLRCLSSRSIVGDVGRLRSDGTWCGKCSGTHCSVGSWRQRLGRHDRQSDP